MSDWSPIRWIDVQTGLYRATWTCWHCGKQSGTGTGYRAQGDDEAALHSIYICSYCGYPVFKIPGKGGRVTFRPSPPMGEPIKHVPSEVSELYEEARRCFSVGAPTAAVMLFRKILMHVAVDRGADNGMKFVEYVDHLDKTGEIPKGSKDWIEPIRKLGNFANHELPKIAPGDAEKMLKFTEMLLKLIYEYPESIKPTAPIPSSGAGISDT